MGKLTDDQKANLTEEVIANAMQCETPLTTRRTR